MKILLRINLFVLVLMILVTVVAISSVSNAQTVAQGIAVDTRSIIQQAENYLQNLKTVKARFVQTSSDGNSVEGTFYLNRPGKLRFEYDHSKDFVVADGIFIYFYDSELGEQTNAPIGQTLANFLLREDLSLTKDLRVSYVSQTDNTISMVLTEKGEEGAGSVKLFFSENPYALTKWQITDPAGLVTEIALSNTQRDIDLPATLFKYFKPKQDKPRYN